MFLRFGRSVSQPHVGEIRTKIRAWNINITLSLVDFLWCVSDGSNSSPSFVNKLKHFNNGCDPVVLQETTITEIKQKIMKTPDAAGIVIDGFPRDVGQALSFEDQVRLINYLNQGCLETGRLQCRGLLNLGIHCYSLLIPPSGGGMK